MKEKREILHVIFVRGILLEGKVDDSEVAQEIDDNRV